MIRVEVELENGAGPRMLTIRARSIYRALELLTDRYPSSRFRVVFPISPEIFFVSDVESAPGLDELVEPEGGAGGARSLSPDLLLEPHQRPENRKSPGLAGTDAGREAR